MNSLHYAWAVQFVTAVADDSAVFATGPTIQDTTSAMRDAAPIAPYAYVQLTHDGKPSGSANAVAESFGAQSFTGFAVYSEEKKFQKVAPADVDKGKAGHVKQSKDGWLAFVQHYFVSAWLPPENVQRDFSIEKRADGAYIGRILTPAAAIAPGSSGTISARLFAGPQEQPFVCMTEKFKTVGGATLGKPLDANCSIATRIDYVYRSTTDTKAFKPLADRRSCCCA